MGSAFRIKVRLRRFKRRHPRLNLAVRVFTIFMATFGSAYGFITGSRSETYDPSNFAIGASFLFALACAALAAMSMRLRWVNRRLRTLAQHNEALIDRNWELKEAEERARSLFESQRDLIVLRDSEGRITFANEAFCELAGKPSTNLLGSDFRFEVLEQGDAAIESNGTRVHDQRLATRLGPRWIAWREAMVRPDAGQPSELQCVGRDVTDRTETERALAAARDQADGASRAKSRFLAMASHEIRTPLNGIIGMSGLLLDTALTPEQSTYAQAVRKSGEALLALIDELLDFSKIEAGKIDLAQRPFALASLIEDVTELLAPRAHAKKIEIASYVDDALPREVIGDAARLRQVLLNLAGNAIKFTAAGGVSIVVEPGIWPGEINFVVTDTGIGIAPEAQARIFREFEQADDQTARNFGGTGLGLAITERIVKRMGGRIQVESEQGRGSTFSIAIMLATANASEAPLTPPDLAGKSILLLSPQPIESSLIARRLECWGAQTCIISDAEVALALLPERAWHAVMIDHTVGVEALEQIADAARTHASRRLVLLTPSARHDYAPPAAITGYLVKPLRAASLAARLTGIPDVISPELAADVPEPSEQGESSRGGLSILVAEDNEINALLIRSLLTKLGHSAVLATNGESAVESFLAASSAGTPYDLVLMDVQMPQLDGIAATRQIRAHEAARPGRRTPIMALTANTLLEDRYACFEAGMDGFLIKPLDRENLTQAIDDMTAAARVMA